MTRVCILTPGQPSSNPRMVKEADALTEAGYTVQVLCAHWAPWADEKDKDLMRSRSWSCNYVDGKSRKGLRYYHSRVRHGISRRLLNYLPNDIVMLNKWAFCRVLPELERAALRIKADLYISHYPETLPAAMAAAEKHDARVGYDIEDFYTLSRKLGDTQSIYDGLVEQTEMRFLPRCDYVTVSSPQIGEAYVQKYKVPAPLTILNVFSSSLRPKEYRPTKRDGALSLYWFSQTIGELRGLEDIVHAMGVLRDCYIELHLRGVCYSEYQRRLIHLAKTAGARPEQVRFHEPASPDEMVRLAAQHDVGLALEQPISENRSLCYLTNKFSTYILAGNAVVATATTGQRSLVAEIGSAGFCYEPGDINALASQLRKWHDDRDALDSARCHSWEWGTLRFNWDIEKNRFLDLVHQTLAAN